MSFAGTESVQVVALLHPLPSPPSGYTYGSNTLRYIQIQKKKTSQIHSRLQVFYFLTIRKKVFNLFTISGKKVLKANTAYYCEHEVNYN